MGETVVLDCSSRIWLAGLARSDGSLQLAPMDLGGPQALYLWSEVFLDLERYEQPQPALLQRLRSVASGNDDFSKLGWHLLGQPLPCRVVPLKQPWQVLSEPGLTGPDKRVVQTAAITLLTFLLTPLVEAARRIGGHPESGCVMVVVDSAMRRSGRAGLLAALRRLGVRRVRLIPRAFALGAYGLFVLGEQEWLGIDAEEEGIDVRRYRARCVAQKATITLEDGLKLSKDGWPRLVELLAGALSVPAPGLRPGQRVARVLFGLGEDTATENVFAFLEAALAAPEGAALLQDIARRLESAAATLDGAGLGRVFSGLALAVPGLECSLRRLLDTGDAFDTTPAPGRAAKGVAAMSGWLAQQPGRQVAFGERADVYLSVGNGLHGLGVEAVLTGLGPETRLLRRLVTVTAPAGDDTIIGLQFFQGVGAHCLDGQRLGLWTQPVVLYEHGLAATLDVQLSLRSPAGPGRPRGTVTVGFGERQRSVRLHFSDCGLVLRSPGGRRTVKSAGHGGA